MSAPEDDPDLSAAEYVIGTLDPADHAAAAARQATDPHFAARVEAWEQRLTPLSEAAREIEPPAHLLPAILRRIGVAAADAPGPAHSAPTSGATVISLNRALMRWRIAAGAATALAACLAAVMVFGTYGTRPAQPTFVALLQRTDAPPAYVIRADLRDKTLAVGTLDAHAPPGRSFELWIIDPSIGPPKSLGVLAPEATQHALPTNLSTDVLTRATYAVTEEAAGGSPNGKPSGPPVFVGHLVQTPL